MLLIPNTTVDHPVMNVVSIPGIPGQLKVYFTKVPGINYLFCFSTNWNHLIAAKFVKFLK